MRSVFRKSRLYRLKRSKAPVVLGILILLVFLSIFGFVRYFKPQILSYSAAALENTVYETVNRVVHETVDEKGFLYDDLATLIKNDDGEIIAVSTQTARLNALKTEVLGRLLTELNRQSDTVVEIPIGTLTGSVFLSGRGPGLPVHMLPVTTVEATSQNSFYAAGVNQTHHEIQLHIVVHTGIVYAGYAADRPISVDVCVAETILLGNTPQFYASIE